MDAHLFVFQLPPAIPPAPPVQIGQNNGDAAQALLDNLQQFIIDIDEIVPQALPVNGEFDDVNYAVRAVDGFSYFRFHRDEIRLIAEKLQLPEIVRTDSGYTMPRDIALSLVMYRLSWPTRYKDAVLLFQMSESKLCSVFNHAVMLIYKTWKHLLLFDHVRLTHQFMEQCALAVREKGAQQLNCWGFIDGTHMEICRPEEEQEEFYSGHKRMHSLKYHAITTPDGMIVHLGGPFAGRRHDARMLTDSKIRDYLAVHARDADGQSFVIYGDEGYGRREEVLAPYRGSTLTNEQNSYNGSMRRPRLCVEWTFGYISKQWGATNYAQNLKVGLSNLGALYPVVAMLSNIQKCLDRGHSGKGYYGMAAPALDEYLTDHETWAATRVVFAEPMYFNADSQEEEEEDGEEVEGYGPLFQIA
jgi:hypothetical protein